MRININLSHIKPEDTIIVANNRQVIALKNSIVAQFGTIKIANIYSYTDFIKNTWIKINPQSSKRLISDFELKLLLTDIVAQDNNKNTNFLTQQTLKCYRLIKSYFIQKELIIASQDEIKLLFIKWINKLEKIKKQLQIIDTTDIFSLIEPVIQNTDKTNNYYYYGIREQTPEQKKLFTILNINKLEKINTQGKIQAISYETQEAEIKSIAKWSKSYIEKYPSKQIAVIIPNLTEQKSQICNIFDEVFQSQKTEIQYKKYNTSLGSSLLKYPLIKNIINIINLSIDINKGFIETKTIIKVAQSPYIIAATKEQNNRAILINLLLKQSKNYFKLNKLITFMDDCPLLAKTINNIAKIKIPASSTTEHWLEIFYQYLDIFSFANEKTLSSSEYQVFEKFHKEILILNKIFIKNNKMNVNKCIELLENHLNDIIFQAKAGRANIHILGLLEAEGLNFDASWIAGMTSNVLPGFIKNYFFIANDIATAFNLPFSSFDNIQQNALNILQELKDISANNTFSYAKTDNSLEQIASPLLEFSKNVDNKAIKTTQIKITKITDYCAPKIKTKNIQQGVQTLQYQISCPFKGFAKRLKVEQAKPAHLGFNKIQQGIIVHKTLEKIFNTIPNIKKLKSLSDESIQELIVENVSRAIGKITKKFQKLEKERIILIINKYLELEKTRDNFEVVATESSIDVCIEGLKFTTKLDRVDKIANAEKIIIDYKTSDRVSIQDTLKENISQVQLPIYAISNNIDGVVLAKVNAKECYFSYIAKDMQCLPNNTKAPKNTSWQPQLETWKNKIHQASNDFQNGLAYVEPDKNACDYCEYDLLCRIEKIPYNN